MELLKLLKEKEEEILTEACLLLTRAHLKNYVKCEDNENKARLHRLYVLMVKSVSSQNLVDMIDYSERIAKERYENGFDFQEVHAAYNVLEEAIWKKIIGEISPENLGESLALISTVLGAGKEALAATYISLAAKTKKPQMDLSALFSRN